MQVDAIHHRDDPILLGSPPMKPPRFHFGLPFRAAVIWSNLEMAGVTDVVGVWQHVAQLMTVVALKQRYAGHAKRAAPDRRRQQLHGPPGRGGGRRRRSLQPRRRDVGGHHALRAGRADRHRAQRLELGARSAHSRRGTSAPASPRIPRRSSRRCGRSAGRTNIRRPRRSPPTRRARSRRNGAARSPGARRRRAKRAKRARQARAASAASSSLLALPPPCPAPK